MTSSCVPEISPKARIRTFRITRVVVATGKLDMFMMIVSFIDINGYPESSMTV